MPSTLDYQDLGNQGENDDDHISNMENSHDDAALSELKDSNGMMMDSSIVCYVIQAILVVF